MDRLGDSEPFFSYGEPIGKRPAFGMAVAQPGPRRRGNAANGTKAFREQLSLERRHISPETLDGPSIVSRVIIDPTQDEMRPGLEANMPKRCRQGQDTLAVVDGAVHLARRPERGAQVGVDPPEPQGIAQRLSQGLGAAQVVEYPPRGFYQDSERSA